MICSAAAFQSPEHLAIAVLASEDSLAQWDWVKWLPHALSRTGLRRGRAAADGVHQPRRPRRPAAARPRRASALRRRRAAARPAHPVRRRRRRAAARQPRDPGRRPARHDRARPAEPLGRARGQHPAAAAVRGRRRDRTTAARRSAPCDCARRRCAPAPTSATWPRPRRWPGGWPRCTSSPAGVEAEPAGAGEITGPSDFMDLLGLGDVHRYDPGSAWRTRPARDRLRVPIGLGDGGGMIHLDIKESAQQGMGPHGLVIGATGSGKSEFLRTLVLGLALTHSPEQLNMVLVDFKGGATFAGMSGDAARLGDDHQPRERAHPGRPHAGRAVRRDGASPGAAARRRQLRVGARLRARPGRRRRPRSRCRRCSSSSTSSPRCSRPSRSSSTSSSRSAGSAGRSACTCCSPRSGWRRAGSAASSRTCPTGSGCGRSPPRSRARCSAYPTPTSCRPMPGLGFLKPDQSTLLRFKAAYVSGPAVRGERSAGRARRDRRRAGDPAVDDHRGAGCRWQPEPRGRARAELRCADRRAGDAARRGGRPDGRLRPGGPPGMAAAARRTRHARRADGRPRARPRARPGLAASGARSAA